MHEMQAMLDELRKDPALCPSAFWSKLNETNSFMLLQDGLAQFKRTVSNNYFNWIIRSSKDPMFRAAFRDWLGHPTLGPLFSSIEPDVTVRMLTSDSPISLTAQERLIYRLYVAFIWEKARRMDTLGLSDTLEEPSIGNPIRIEMGGRMISQDLANSVIEANAILPGFDPAKPVRFCEIGAGYGRLGYVISKTRAAQVFIFDVPPALQVAQWYAEQALPEKRIFAFRPFDKFGDVENELARADIAFFTANQIRLFPDSYFDAIATISTLPELTPGQFDIYLAEMQRLSSKTIYVKQWKSWTNPDDGHTIRREDYKLGPAWTNVLDRQDPLVPYFFNAVWEKR